MEFFGLDNSYTRKDLKRAYTRRIKEFKPEKFPIEFQKIREAYEQLEEALRYGHSFIPESAIDGVTASKPIENPSEIFEGPHASFPSDTKFISPFTERYPIDKFENLDAILKTLEKNTEKLPEEYCLLALIKEQKQGQAAYFEAIIEGIIKYHDNSFLNQQFYQCCKLEYDVEFLRNILTKMSAALPSFYYKTEKLWHQFFEKSDFPKFIKLFDHCTDQLRFDEQSNASIFYSRFICRYFFQCPLDWVTAITQSFENEPLERQEFLDYEINLIDALIDYRTTCSTITTTAIGKEIYNLIVIYCEQTGPKVEAAFYKCMSEIRNIRKLTASIKPGDLRWQNCYWLFNLIHSDVITCRTDQINQMESTRDDIARATRRFLGNMEKHMDNGISGLLITGTTLGFFLIHTATIFASLFVTGYLFADSTHFIGIHLGVWFLWLLLYIFVLRHKVINHFRGIAVSRVARSIYLKKWRAALINFMHDNVINEEQFIDHAMDCYENTDINCSGHIIGFVHEDFAISFSSLSIHA